MIRYKKNPNLNHVLVTGGAGYVGAILVPKMIEAGYKDFVMMICQLPCAMLAMMYRPDSLDVVV